MSSEDVGCVGGWFLWNMEEMHVRLFESSAAFVVIAGGTGRHNVRPDMLTAQMSGDDVVYGQASVLTPAVLAGIIVPAENFAARQFDVRPWPVNLHIEAYHGRSWD